MPASCGACCRGRRSLEKCQQAPWLFTPNSLRTCSYFAHHHAQEHEAGLTVCKLLQAGVLPSGEAVCCVPSTLVALCLNVNGLKRVEESQALQCLVPIFTTPNYLRALQVCYARRQCSSTPLLALPYTSQQSPTFLLINGNSLMKEPIHGLVKRRRAPVSSACAADPGA